MKNKIVLTSILLASTFLSSCSIDDIKEKIGLGGNSSPIEVTSNMSYSDYNTSLIAGFINQTYKEGEYDVNFLDKTQIRLGLPGITGGTKDDITEAQLVEKERGYESEGNLTYNTLSNIYYSYYPSFFEEKGLDNYLSLTSSIIEDNVELGDKEIREVTLFSRDKNYEWLTDSTFDKLTKNEEGYYDKVLPNYSQNGIKTLPSNLSSFEDKDSVTLSVFLMSKNKYMGCSITPNRKDEPIKYFLGDSYDKTTGLTNQLDYDKELKKLTLNSITLDDLEKKGYVSGLKDLPPEEQETLVLYLLTSLKCNLYNHQIMSENSKEKLNYTLKEMLEKGEATNPVTYKFNSPFQKSESEVIEEDTETEIEEDSEIVEDKDEEDNNENDEKEKSKGKTTSSLDLRPDWEKEKDIKIEEHYVGKDKVKKETDTQIGTEELKELERTETTEQREKRLELERELQIKNFYKELSKTFHRILGGKNKPTGVNSMKDNLDRNSEDYRETLKMIYIVPETKKKGSKDKGLEFKEVKTLDDEYKKTIKNKEYSSSYIFSKRYRTPEEAKKLDLESYVDDYIVTVREEPLEKRKIVYKVTCITSPYGVVYTDFVNKLQDTTQRKFKSYCEDLQKKSYPLTGKKVKKYKDFKDMSLVEKKLYQKRGTSIHKRKQISIAQLSELEEKEFLNGHK